MTRHHEEMSFDGECVLFCSVFLSLVAHPVGNRTTRINYGPSAGTSKLQFRVLDIEAPNLTGADLEEADLEGADLEGANLEAALSLEGTNLRRVKGLTKEQLEACKAKGAIIDEDTTTNPPQSTVSSPPLSQSNDAQIPSATPTQVNTPPTSADGNNRSTTQQSNNAQVPSTSSTQESTSSTDSDGSSTTFSQPNAKS